MDIASVFAWFAQESISIAEQANDPKQREMFTQLALLWQLLRNSAAVEQRRCNLQHRVSWALLLAALRGFSSHQNRLGCLNAVVVYAQQLAGRGVCVKLSLLDHEYEAAQTVQGGDECRLSDQHSRAFWARSSPSN